MNTFLHSSANERWNRGSAELLLHPLESYTLQTAVRCRIEGFEDSVVASLDTGSSHTIIGGEHAEELLETLKGAALCGRLSCRFGEIDVWACTVKLTLINDSVHGLDMELEVEARLAPEFPLPLVIGVDGMLDHLRVALDPGVGVDDPARWYFGPVGGP